MKQLALILLLTTAAFAGELTGKWTGTFETTGPDGSSRPSSAYMDLKLAGEAVTGTAGPDESRQTVITSGKLDGQKLTFEVVQGGGAGTTMKFDLTFDGETIKGTATAEREGQRLQAKIDLKRK